MIYVVIRADSERNIEKIAASWNKDIAKQALTEDFKEYLLRKYQIENSTNEDISYDAMLEYFDEYDCDLSDMTAFVNEVDHIDYDWKIIECDEKETAPDDLLKKINEAEEKADDVAGAEAFTDADTILKDIMDEQDWEVSGIAIDLFERYKRAICKTEFEELFQFFTCMKFKDFLEKCAKETRRL